MPAYKHLYKKNSDFETAYAEALTQKQVFNVPYDAPNGVKLGNLDEAKALFMQEAERIVADMKNEDIKEAFKRGEVREIVALIAYLNGLGQGRIAK